MRLRGILFSSILILSLVALTGCKSDTTAPANTNSFPGVGSTFTVANWEDNTDLQDTTTYQIANADTTFDGKQHAVKMIQLVLAGLPQPDPFYLAFEANGDVSVWPKPSLSRADWFTIPYATQAHGATNWDPDGTDSSMTIADGDSPSSGSITINGTAYPTERVKVTIMHDMSVAVHHYAYSPALRFRVSDDEDALPDGTQFAQHWKLVSFVKK
ncbi:MAG: hypothetical protein Q8922_00410 [Bacteroidota bacterium]|nr:hypothetical protein [Bacteroidota bacterium]MDP4232495.1 hypothetical protein [Bacteroidota bacterium]MDP4241631.1 hypothetical protein [Bacteroidota bacterium]MDP4286375.1 hypothetical protein [Bacteroidota bacterium]